MGNVHSVQNALQFLGLESTIVTDGDQFEEADCIILPGVGAFGDGMQALCERGLVDAIHQTVERQQKLIGICLGMQLLLNWSYEMGEYEGLGLVAGEVIRFEPKDPKLKVPHMGWNTVKAVQDDVLFEGIALEAYCYFVHSYYVKPQDPSVVLASTNYGGEFCSILKQGQLYGLQFHPEKSQSVGLAMLANLLKP